MIFVTPVVKFKTFTAETLLSSTVSVDLWSSACKYRTVPGLIPFSVVPLPCDSTFEGGTVSSVVVEVSTTVVR